MQPRPPPPPRSKRERRWLFGFWEAAAKKGEQPFTASFFPEKLLFFLLHLKKKKVGKGGELLCVTGEEEQKGIKERLTVAWSATAEEGIFLLVPMPYTNIVKKYHHERRGEAKKMRQLQQKIKKRQRKRVIDILQKKGTNIAPVRTSRFCF